MEMARDDNQHEIGKCIVYKPYICENDVHCAIVAEAVSKIFTPHSNPVQ